MGILCSTFESKLVHNLHFLVIFTKVAKSTCHHICLSACMNSAPSGQMCVKFDIGDLINLFKTPDMVKVWQKY